ncbi:sodium:solute symporter [Sagittula sp. P11]|uniref:sensor histidine kinase n=1 Tax=unclassified Sagittula TaxID=2624628 RepID=UPI000C2CFD2D|nr:MULTISPECIES: sensor histidine kinase [unclassified Sagittula]AUC52347.1 sodium:solute symporter [Sagittula sp. P11]WHZ36421.1 sensor histidine kinase [Sagittula sp. MA-2]
MNTLNALAAISLAYVALLFSVAFFAERSAARGRGAWLRSPVVYTLSLSIYCTGWTFYGAVGSAARTGLEYLTIYLGPSLVMIGWWWILRKLVRIARSQRITSIADLISSRYGKSNLLGVGVTILAVVGTTPYIALQLQSVTLSVEVFTRLDAGSDGRADTTAFWVAVGLAVFTVIFGTRNLDSNERHHGVVMAIAVEAVVKLTALLAVGSFVVWGMAGGVSETLARIDASDLGQWEVDGGRWAGLMLLSAAAFLCLPRMFQVLVVENDNDAQLRTAAWAFPLYMMLMSFFVMPIAVIGMTHLPAGANPDLFVLTLPLSQGQNGLALLTFLGGFSSATSMVIVAAIALSTMVSNHIVMPIWLELRRGTASVSGDVRNVVLLSRRLSIGGVLLLGYLYYALSGGGAALATIGLVSFTGVAQVLPAMLGGIFWRGATRSGALAGLTFGFATWLYTLYLPSLGAGTLVPEAWFAQGPLGIGWLRPEALFGITGMDPLLHAVFWSLTLNTVAFFVVSVFSFPSPLERLQGAQFVNIQQAQGGARSWLHGTAQTEDLMIMAQRILGAQDARDLFRREAERQGSEGQLPAPTPEFLQRLERTLSGSVGAATAHAMVGQIVGGMAVSVEDLMAVADETAQMMEYSARLETQSRELSRTAAELRAANDKLTRLSVQKDAFLSQISHELRTPMTSIRAFSEILRDAEGLSRADQNRYASIIYEEAIRLTRLLDDLLDLSVLENGQVSLNVTGGRLSDVIDRAVAAALADDGARLKVIRHAPDEQVWLNTDLERLSQVFINLVANARKYCDAEAPELRIRVHGSGDRLHVDFIDNGSGVAPEARDVIFEKFARVSDQKAGGAGLGLAICRQIVARLGGEITYLQDHSGAAFRVDLPMSRQMAAQ